MENKLIKKMLNNALAIKSRDQFTKVPSTLGTSIHDLTSILSEKDLKTVLTSQDFDVELTESTIDKSLFKELGNTVTPKEFFDLLDESGVYLPKTSRSLLKKDFTKESKKRSIAKIKDNVNQRRFRC